VHTCVTSCPTKPDFSKKYQETVLRTYFSHCMCWLGIAAFALSGAAAAQTRWPGKPITLVVPFGPGNAPDISARLIANRLGPALGTSVIVDNRPGAAGSIGSDYAARAPADGYTILLGTFSSHAVNPSLYAKLAYDPVKSFVPITLIGTNSNVLIAGAGGPFRSVADLVAAARAKPGTLDFASTGNGSSQHLSGELLKRIAGIDLVHIPFKTGAITAILSGQVPVMFENTASAEPHIRAGRVRALAVTSRKRSDILPEVPTMAELGYKDFEVISWSALYAPAGTPRPIVMQIQAAVSKILGTPEVLQPLRSLGIEAAPGTPEQLADFQAAETVKWAKVIKDANIQIE
jgi:tripartite-type tricarboxylate transporter receptor subunit TctC